MSRSLPLANNWYRTHRVDDRVSRIDEPHVDVLLQANIWHIEGSRRDLVFDTGLGIVSLREALPDLFLNDPIMVLSHAHLDHVGSAHEFTDRRGSGYRSTEVIAAASLRGPRLAQMLGLDLRDEELPPILIDAVPDAEYSVDDYHLAPLDLTTQLAEGDRIDLGDQTWDVLHLPGHTPDSICLFNQETGALLSGDVIVDDILLDEIHGSDVPDYVDSMRRLLALPVSTVYPGHGEPFSGRRMKEIAMEYIEKRTAG